METVVVQINNNQAFNFLENLEALNLIKVLKRIPNFRFEGINPLIINDNPDKVDRISEIQSITKDINIDLTNFHFNRDEANNYD